MELATSTDEHVHLDNSHNTNLAAMADLALIVGDAVLPAHCYVMAASSPALGQLLSERVAEQRSMHMQGNCVKPVSLDLSGDGLACAQAALRFLYSVCPYHGEQPEIESAEEAEHLATFGQKYGATFMCTAADDYLYHILTKSHNLIKCYGSGFTPSHATQAKEQLPVILKWALFAETKGLTKTLQHCEAWLAHHFTLYPDAYEHLCCLKKSSMIKIMLLLKQRVRDPCGPYH